ncbi:MAG: hypothetical protein Q9160_008770 [Pyrenula sp. 1 TL-2023]
MPFQAFNFELLCLFHVLSFTFRIVTSQAAWPSNTQVTASSEHEPEGLAFYYAKFAIDGDNSTLWSDKTNNSFPDTLRIGPPSPITLSGLSITSNLVGWITAYRVEVLTQKNSWTQVAELQDVPSISSRVTFAEPIQCLQIQVIVDNATTSDDHSRYTRITEIEPHIVSEGSSATSNQATTSTTESSMPSEPAATDQQQTQHTSSDTNAISNHKGIIIGSVLGGIAFLGFLVIVLFIILQGRNQRKGQTLPPAPWPWDRMKEPDITETKGGQELETKPVCEACGAETPRAEIKGTSRAELEGQVYNEKMTDTPELHSEVSPISPASTLISGPLQS